MNEKEKFELIARNTEEILTEENLKELIKKKKSPIAYCGYEISGAIHLGHLVTITKLLDLQKAGFKIKILLADIHTKLNKKIPEIDAWKNTIKAIGIKAEFVLGSDFQFTKEYLYDVFQLAQKVTLNRGLRSMQEVARDVENATVSQIIYPLMQIVDVKHLEADVAVGGTDQRKNYMLGKEESKLLHHNFIALHTPLITSLKGPGQKMSSSIPGSNISIIDSHEQIKKAISQAYCPAGKTEDNPVLQIAKLIIIPHFGKLKITRDKKFGGEIIYMTYKDLESDYKKEALHPADLKSAVVDSLEKLIAPIRKNFR